MSLQSAPLGQLPSMSMPYSIPRYEKGPSLWEKALGALLVNAAGTVADKATTNVMSSDNAAEFGQTPRTGFGRLLDPVVGDKEAAQLREQRFQSGESKLGREFQTGQHQLSNEETQAAAEVAARNAQLLEGQRLQGGLDEQMIRDLNARERTAQELSGNAQNLRLKQELENQSPETQARTGLYKSQGGHYDSQAAFERHMLDMLSRSGKQSGIASGGPALSDADRIAIEQLRAGNGAPSVVNPFTGSGADASTYTSGLSDVQALLAQGVPVEQIPAIVQRQQAVNTRAQAMPAGSTTPMADPRRQVLLRQLGMVSDPSVYSTPDIFN